MKQIAELLWAIGILAGPFVIIGTITILISIYAKPYQKTKRVEKADRG